MKNAVSAVLTGAMLFASVNLALAAESEGVVTGVDPTTRSIMLEDGTIWTAAEGVDLTEITAGDMIKVTYEDGTTVVTAVEKAPM